MSDVAGAIREGHYAKKQLFTKSALISWSHRRRFDTALKLARKYPGARVLDHGCGDGTFLAMLMSGEMPPTLAVGTEISEGLVQDCATRFADVPGLRFVRTASLDTQEHEGAYDLVTCMEVLEHVVDLEQELDRLQRLLSDSGVLIVSVPVETGLPLAVKQVARRIAGWRGIGDYPGDSPYTTREFLASLVAGRSQHIRRPVHQNSGGPFHSHKGFNWMRLRDLLAERFHLEDVTASPVASLPPQLNSQAWLIARPRARS